MGFSLKELILVIILTYPAFRFAPTTLVNRLPQITRLPRLAGSPGFHRASGTIRLSDYSHGIVSRFAFAYRVPYPSATRKPCESSWGHALIFHTVPPANTLVRWVDENAFASIVQARPCPTFGRLVHPRGGPRRLRPGISPQTLQIPPHGGHPVLRLSYDKRKCRFFPLAVSSVSGFVPV